PMRFPTIFCLRSKTTSELSSICAPVLPPRRSCLIRVQASGMYPVAGRMVGSPIAVPHGVDLRAGTAAVGAETRVMGGGGLRPGQRAPLRGAPTGQPPHRILHHHTEPPAGSPERSGGNPNRLGARFDVLRICRQVPPKEVFGRVYWLALFAHFGPSRF